MARVDQMQRSGKAARPQVAQHRTAERPFTWAAADHRDRARRNQAIQAVSAHGKVAICMIECRCGSPRPIPRQPTQAWRCLRRAATAIAPATRSDSPLARLCSCRLLYCHDAKGVQLVVVVITDRDVLAGHKGMRCKAVSALVIIGPRRIVVEHPAGMLSAARFVYKPPDLFVGAVPE